MHNSPSYLPRSPSPEVPCERTPLMRAIEQQDCELTETLLQHDPSLGPDEKVVLSMLMQSGNLALLQCVQRYVDVNVIDFAIESGHLHLVAHLLTTANLINKPNTQGMRPLHQAARVGNLEITDYLIARGASCVALDWHNQTPAMVALANDHLDVYQRLVVHDPVSFKRVNFFGQGLLHLAASKGLTSTVAEQLTLGADLEADTSDGTALLLAVAHGHLESVALLIDRGANIEAENSRKNRALYLAVESKHLKMVQLLMQRGCNPNATNGEGFTPLHQAVFLEHIEIIDYLLQHGADPNSREFENGLTPLGVAYNFTDNVAVIERLAAYGASVREVDEHGYTVLHGAVSFGKVNIVRYLINQGINVNAQTLESHTPPLFLCFFLYPDELRLEIASLLLDAGADINASNAEQSRLIHFAADRVDSGFVNFLCQHGADANARDMYHMTSLHVISNHDNYRDLCKLERVVSTLTQAGADLYALCGIDGCTPIELAINRNHPSAFVLAPRYSTHHLGTLYRRFSYQFDKIKHDETHALHAVITELAKREWQRLQAQPSFDHVLRLSNLGLFGFCRSPQNSTVLPVEIQHQIAKEHLLSDARRRLLFVKHSMTVRTVLRADKRKRLPQPIN